MDTKKTLDTFDMVAGFLILSVILGIICLLLGLLIFFSNASTNENDSSSSSKVYQITEPVTKLVSNIASDETVIFLPTIALFHAQADVWEIPVHGWIFEPEENSFKRKLGLATLAKAFGLESEDQESEIFKKRARMFLVDNERGKKIYIRIGENTYFAGESSANGHFKETLILSSNDVKKIQSQEQQNSWLHFQAVTAEDEKRVFAGKVLLVPNQGLTVISDIDDTLKITNVLKKKELLKNTFLREFQVVPGMADWYQKIFQKKGAMFHFVSSSPWQLYPDLLSFFTENQFPNPTFHLKHFRIKDSTFFDLFASGEETKPKIIAPILEQFPHRKFILVGDSGEKDPEVYGEMARQYPKQVIHIWIRDVTGDLVESPRYQKAFKDVPAELWQIFKNPEEIRYLK